MPTSRLDRQPDVATVHDHEPGHEHGAPTLVVLPWHDAVVERIGHPVDSAYVELFWLGILGPTATWLLRRLDAGFAEHPTGYEIDLPDVARSLGVSYTPHPTNAFTRALQRCIMFGLAQQVGASGGTIAVRRCVPPLSRRHLERLPRALQTAHAVWQRPTAAVSV